MDLSRAIDLLLAESSSLKELAAISGIPSAIFYNGADLRDLDLRDQDLRGLNFQGADLRGSRLEGVLYNMGAFNGALLNEEFNNLHDDYTFYVDDMLLGPLERFYFYVSFRSISIENLLAFAGRSYAAFANLAEIGIKSLRRARRGHPVSSPTALRICRALKELVPSDIGDSYVKSMYVSIFSQPLMKFHGLDYVRDKIPHEIDRENFLKLFMMDTGWVPPLETKARVTVYLDESLAMRFRSR